MAAANDVMNAIANLVGGPVMLVLILGVGVMLIVRLPFFPMRQIGYGFRLLWRGRKVEGSGDISAFSALMTALSATIGTGNIAGVALAITLGGPGALFWMWVSAVVGLGTKYGEAVLAVHFREKDKLGAHIGGPMYYIKNGLGEKWKPLAATFAFFGAIAAFGIGNMVQSNTIASAFQTKGVEPIWVGAILSCVVGLVLMGGIKRIAAWATYLVPFFAVLYVSIGLIVVFVHVNQIPSVFAEIITSAFTGDAVTGASVWLAIRYGVTRGVFSNEAGLGSAAIAHAAAATTDPVKQGTIAMLGTFIDTLVVCTITGFVVLSTGVWQTTGLTGAPLTTAAMATVIPMADYIILMALVIFGFTTILGWSYYGEKCTQYLFGYRSIFYYRLLYVVAVFMGTLTLTMGSDAKVGIEFIWLTAEIFNAFMAIPNLIALALLTPVIVHLTKAYYYGDGKAGGLIRPD